MIRINTRKTARALTQAACMLGLSGAASAAPLVSEDFNDITGLASPTAVRAIQNVLANNPSQLPSGANSINLLGSNADVNVRRGDNAINTSTGSQGFDSFFGTATGNQFLVLGDQGGQVGGNPNGGAIGQAFAFYVPFSVGANSAPLSVSFDWAFDGTDTSSSGLQTDRFLAGVVGGSNLSLSSLSSGNPVSLFGQLLVDKKSPTDFGVGTFTQTMGPLAQGNYLLAFVHLEAFNGSATNTAVGIDNINVSAVPVPAAIWLLGSALTGVISIGRRQQRSEV